MKTFKQYSNMALFSALFMMTFIMGGCGGSSSCDDTSRPATVLDDTTSPYVISTVPTNDATDVPLNRIITSTANEALNPATVNSDTFTLTLAGDTTPILGVVTSANNVMSFDPTDDLLPGIEYTATVTTGVTDVSGNALESDYTWNFTTGTSIAQGPDPISLGTAGNFAILSKTGIATTGTTFIVGDIGVSPATLSAITGFDVIADSTNTFATSTLVDGKIYAADLTPPTPANLTTAVSNMETAYTDAAGRTAPAPQSLGDNITGVTYAPGIYKTDTGVLLNVSGVVTISGGPDDVWIFQIGGDLTVSDSASVILEGGAQAKNIFWQVAGGTGVTLNASSHFEGIVLAAKAIILKDGATVNGRLLSQTAVTLIANDVTQP